MTPDLDKLSERAGKASEGPWKTSDECSPDYYYSGWEVYGPGACCIDKEEDAAFIAASREAVPALIEEVRRLRGVLEEIDTIQWGARGEVDSHAFAILEDIGQRAREAIK